MIYHCLNCAIPRMFADDTSVSYAAKSMDELQSVINSELVNLHKWLNTNKLSLNIAKTEFMIIGSRQRISAMDDRIYYWNQRLWGRESWFSQIAGGNIDKHSNWSIHIEKISKKIVSAIGALKRIRLYVTTNTAIQVYRALIATTIFWLLLLGLGWS